MRSSLSSLVLQRQRSHSTWCKSVHGLVQDTLARKRFQFAAFFYRHPPKIVEAVYTSSCDDVIYVLDADFPPFRIRTFGKGLFVNAVELCFSQIKYFPAQLSLHFSATIVSSTANPPSTVTKRSSVLPPARVKLFKKSAKNKFKPRSCKFSYEVVWNPVASETKATDKRNHGFCFCSNRFVGNRADTRSDINLAMPPIQARDVENHRHYQHIGELLNSWFDTVSLFHVWSRFTVTCGTTGQCAGFFIPWWKYWFEKLHA